MSRAPQDRTSRTDAPGVPARRAALRLLDAVLRRGLALEQALAGSTQGLAPNDRGLAHAIAAETLRRLADLDALIDSATQRPLPHDAKARFALRIALAQAVGLGTPGHAAIATVLPLVDGGPRKLVHGVFGTLMRRGVHFPEVPALPDAVAERWHRNWGEAVVEAASRAIAAPPPLDLTLQRPTQIAQAVSLAPGHLRLPSGSSVPELPGYAEGDWWVQDIAASIPARLIGAGAGSALDLCAAPGGKSLQLAAAGWDVASLDISESRLARLRENSDRTGLDLRVIAADILQWQPETPAQAVLLDVPCSATGIFRRHPDVLHRVRPALIREMAELQARLLDRAAEWVQPGGVLVFSTCSLEPEEGEAQLTRFLSEHPDYAIDPARADELPVGIVPRGDGALRLLPGTLAEAGGCDGFFIVRLRRQG
ncbi:RsmB/NOP family class I SAM-dependent RNA methyltransferase [Sphingomonas sp. S2-65]|uniref:RsmB/NOP family class I SAM-dependent RNA methyltransferase n=1 Tax=Sphingomonas sp. S2-65 TaxID=2903960 RepID=UPI001F15EB0D|nr:RsmB/NOP family class I SAM-dependent RNA methyltransferase [Sphingomonas sp. S2-65]UYY57290.1 RsmB/NOP family class I SAM-dependent RNA methyltransferase [Sphingomonas sp. S2-65]